jgi:hypothetical protein
MQSSSELAVQQAVGPGAAAVEQYLCEYEQGRRDPEITLTLIIEAAEAIAARDSNLEWAAVVVRAAEIGALEDGGKHRHAYLYRAMQLRTQFICQLGSEPGHPVLDAQTVVDWFRGELRFSPAEAKQMSVRWKDEAFTQQFGEELRSENTSEHPRAKQPTHLADTLNELLELRLLKFRLQLIRRLAECGELPYDPEINAWLQTARHLP